jgi:hypothetical protein
MYVVYLSLSMYSPFCLCTYMECENVVDALG